MMTMGGYSIFSFQTNSRNRYLQVHSISFLSKEGTECFKASMIADLADIHANNKIGMPSYSKQSSINQSRIFIVNQPVNTYQCIKIGNCYGHKRKGPEGIKNPAN